MGNRIADNKTNHGRGPPRRVLYRDCGDEPYVHGGVVLQVTVQGKI